MVTCSSVKGEPLAPILYLLEVMVELMIALGHLQLAKLVTILFLLQYKQQIVPLPEWP